METIICPVCHTTIKLNQPPSTSIPKQISLYLGSILLPPFGIIWGWPYLRQSDNKSKLIGLITIILTIVSAIVFTRLTLGFVTSFQAQLTQQLQNAGGIY